MDTSNLPFSTIRKLKETDANGDGENKKKTREEYKKAKQLEEDRKAGTVPAALDEEGKEINPHIPQYISTVPWYFGSLESTLKHQRPQSEKEKTFCSLNNHYIRGVQGKQSTKFRKGACDNCGAMGHNKKECFERPRKVGARYTNTNIFTDDVLLPKIAFGYDGKRDRWNGFNPTDYKAVVEEHEKVEDYKHQLKAQKLRQGQEMNNENDDDSDEKYAENIDMPGTKVDSKQRITVRNLRIREDTAKYLRNLDPKSAHYDPKTRSMRDNPYKNTGKVPEEVDFAGENFIKYSGDTVEQAKAQLFAWEAFGKGIDVSLQAEPTKLEILKKEFWRKREEYKNKISADLLQKYGGKEHLEVPPQALILAQTENYVEYSRHGHIVKGAEKGVIRSKYDEDIHPNNHVSVWGSYWINGRWGYKCCYSFVQNSYCTGEAGKHTRTTDMLTSIPIITVKKSDETEVGEKSLVELHQEKLFKKCEKEKKRRNKKKRKKENSTDNSSSNESDSEDGESKEKKRKMKLRNALIKAKLEEDAAQTLLLLDDRNRNYNSRYEHKVLTEEEIEAYRIRMSRPEDPMASFMRK